MQRCMQYAVEHHTKVRQATLELDNYEASRLGVIGSFLPSVDAGIGLQYNFGRAIDPETNGYTDVSTFYNGYSVQASLPVFDGFSRLHALKAAKASVLMGRNALREQQDQTALATLQAWVNSAYYERMVVMAEEKQRETDLLVHQTEVMVEVGRKSAADLAQIESQQAEAAYELTRQQNLLASALLDLKKTMGFPLADSIICSVSLFTVLSDESEQVRADSLRFTVYGLQFTDDYSAADEGLARLSTVNRKLSTVNKTTRETHPELLVKYYSMRSRLYEWRQARASLFPSLSVGAGLNTTYYKTLHSETAASFSSQFRNNLGEYVSASLSIPLFDRLKTLTSIRRARNNYRIAREAYEEKQVELEKLSREAWQDWQGYQKQAQQMEKKVEADSLAYQLTRRQFEEGLSTAIDLRTTSAQLLQSKATLLQCRLMAIVKEMLVRYYQGDIIWQ